MNSFVYIPSFFLLIAFPLSLSDLNLIQNKDPDQISVSASSKNSYKYAYTSYQPSVICDPALPIQRPKDLQDVKELVKFALKNGLKIKAVGHGLSRTDIICTEGMVIDMRLLKNMTYDEGSEILNVQAGAEIREILEFLHEKKRGLNQIPSYSEMTIGGCLGTEGCHGSSLLHPSLSDQIVGISILNGGDGDEREIFHIRDLNAFRANLGLLGIVTSVRLKTVPQYKVSIGNALAKEELLFNGNILHMARAFDFLQVFWYPSFQEIVISQGEYLKSDEFTEEAQTYLYSDVDGEFVKCLGILFEGFQASNDTSGMKRMEKLTQKVLVENVEGLKPIFTDSSDEYLVNPAIGYSHKLLTSQCKACRWSQGWKKPIYDNTFEITIDLRLFPDAMRDIKAIISETEASFPLFGIYIRFGVGSSTLLGTSQGSEVAHIEISSPQRENRFRDPRLFLSTQEAIAQLLVLAYNGRPEWGKSGLYFLNQNILNRNYPQLPLFRQYMSTIDPKGHFHNTFASRILNRGENKYDSDPRSVHCALEDECICRRDEDCAEDQVCTFLKGQRVCKDEGKNQSKKSERNQEEMNRCKAKYLRD